MSRFERRAVMDIGTNSVKLLVAEVADRVVRPLHETSQQTRLGEGFYKARRLQKGPITKTAAAVAEFAQTAREWEAQSIRVIATSAARDAKNSAALINAVKRASGLKVEIISGKLEAHWAFEGVTSDPKLARTPLLLLDVGGGSTEFILGQGEEQFFRHSFPLGTVRLLEKFPPHDPPSAQELATVRSWARQFLQKRVRPKLMAKWHHAAGQGKVQLVGTGGTVSILARMQAQTDAYDRDQLERTRLSVAAVRKHVKKLWSLPLVERQKIIGLPANRADVILMGAVIFEAIMEEFAFATLRISTRGLRFAALMDAV